jgi:cell division protein FtsQ
VGTPAATAAGRRRATARPGRSKSDGRRSRRRGAAGKPSRRKSTGRARTSRRLSFTSWRRRLIALGLLAGVLAVAYFAWFRHSGFVAVERVRIEGVTGADRDRITTALTEAAGGMTTLDVDEDELAAAVSGFPSVASVSADPSFPHALTVQVTERVPVLVASEGEHRRVPVAADGSVLPGLDVDGSTLPVLKLDNVPESGRLGGEPLAEARVIGAAPPPLRPQLEGATTTKDSGTVVTTRQGIELRFGTPSEARAKWAAAAAVLADPKVTSLEYLDVRVPSRPAIGS